MPDPLPLVPSLRATYTIVPDRAAITRMVDGDGYWPVADGNGMQWPVAAVLQTVREQVREVPGIMAKRDGTWFRAAYDAAWLVEAALDAWGLPYRITPDGQIHHPRPFDAEAEEGLVASIRECGTLRPWLVTPGGPFTLTSYQRAAVWFACERAGGLWDMPPGSGKTVSAVTWAELGGPGPILAVTKNSVTTQFARAVAQFSRSRPLDLPAPSQAPIRKGQRVPLPDLIREYLDWCDYQPAFDAYVNGRPWVVVGWDTLIYVAEALAAVPWASVVFDESHLGKSDKRWRFAKGLHGTTKTAIDTRSSVAWRLACQIPRRLAMTGSPQPDRRRDWWGQLSLVSDAWEDTSGRFTRRYCGAEVGDAGYWDTSGESNTEEFTARCTFSVFAVPEALVAKEMPPLRLSVRFVAPREQDKTDPWFRKEAKRLAKDAARGDLSARQSLAELELQEAAARKTGATVALVEDYVSKRGDGTAKGKVVVLTGRHADCWALAQAVERTATAAGVEVLCGVRAKLAGHVDPATAKPYTPLQVTRGPMEVLEGAERQAMQDRYMAHPGPCVLVATGQAWGTGLDLHDSDLLAIVMLPYSPGDLDQWMRRVQRLGMNRPCQIVILVAEGTVDERRASIVVDKARDITVTTSNASLADVAQAIRGTDEAGLDRTVEEVLAKIGRAAAEEDEGTVEGLWL